MTDDHPPSGILSKKDVVDLLLRKYAIMKSDLLTQIGALKNHVRNSQFVATAVTTVVVFLLGKDSAYALSSETKYIWIFISLAISSITYYLIFDVLEANFAVQSVSERIATLEQRINQIVGYKLLIWESAIVPQVWGKGLPLRLVHPIYCMFFYETILIVFITLIFPSIVYYRAWALADRDSALSAIICVCIAYTLVSSLLFVWVWWSTNVKLRPRLNKLLEKEWPDFADLVEREKEITER